MRRDLPNENIIGDEPHWLDSARNMLHTVNTSAAQIPPPTYGIGQAARDSFTTPVFNPRAAGDPPFPGYVSEAAPD